MFKQSKWGAHREKKNQHGDQGESERAKATPSQ